MNLPIDRRAFVRGAAAVGVGAGLAGLFPAWAQNGSHGIAHNAARAGFETLSGESLALRIGRTGFAVGGRSGHAITVNGTLPAPLLRLREGQKLRIDVTNALDEDSSIHWHGLLLQFQMDGVPGVSFPGIKPGETFRYEFPVRQAGTYWYHSHSGLQEQEGLYGPIVIDPAEPDPNPSEREHVIVLSDWTFLHPHQVIARLKQEGGFFNRQKQTLTSGTMSAADRAMWGRMRMDPTDIADVTGATYTYLVNGHGPAENWTGLFRPGERVRLRVINASAQTIFNLRIPGLQLTVIEADGQRVRPVTVAELQIGNAETYDLLVTPAEDRAYTIVAESIDRSGMARATLAPRLGMAAAVPPLRERPTLTMKDMGMGGMGGMAGMDHGAHGGMNHGGGAATGGGMSHDMRDLSKLPPTVKAGVGVDMVAPMPVDRTGDPGLGLETVDHKVLTYRDLMSAVPNPDTRAPTRTVEVHLTGNMERFMWSLDGRKFSENPEPIRFERNERVRIVMVNDSMMTHPMHLHGHFFEVVNGHNGYQPLKHTVMVLPGGKVDIDLTADAPGDWAFHCHMLYHMHAGMMRVVTVRPLDGGDAA